MISASIPAWPNHCNRAPFWGILTVLNSPSRTSPSGGRGHRVMLSGDEARKALPSLIGMGLCADETLRNHDHKRKIGVITAARIVGDSLIVDGHIFARDFPESVQRIRETPQLGMSFEIAETTVADMRRSIWELTNVTFIGAAVLLDPCYEGTHFSLRDTDVQNQ